MKFSDEVFDDPKLTEAIFRTLSRPNIAANYEYDLSEITNFKKDSDAFKSFLRDPRFDSIPNPDNPVLPILDAKASTSLQYELWKKIWGEKLEKNRDKIDDSISSIGCIKFSAGSSNSSYSPIGTGYVLKDNIIVTNSHVLKNEKRSFITTNKNTKKTTFKPNDMGGERKISVRINFSENWRSSDLEFDIVDVLYFPNQEALELGLDIVLLKVNETSISKESLPKPLKILPGLPSDKVDIFIVGYPDKDNQDNELEWSKIKSFVNEEIKTDKYVSLGKITLDKDKNNNFQHDCPSIPGNSGSPVILLETGEVIGIHFNGKNQVNSAVSIDKVTQILDTL